jgi:hypothetical protein
VFSEPPFLDVCIAQQDDFNKAVSQFAAVGFRFLTRYEQDDEN